MSKLISFSKIISTFGASAKSKLSNIAIDGAPEDQLRAPLEHLTAGLLSFAALLMAPWSWLASLLSELKTRPDYAVSVKRLSRLRGGKGTRQGSDPRRFVDKHDKEQWKSSSLCRMCSTQTAMASACGAMACSREV